MGKVMAFPLKTGTQKKPPRPVRCPDEYLPLPPAPKLYEADPVMVADIEDAGRKFAESIEKYRDRMPTFWWDVVIMSGGASYIQSAINVGNKQLLEAVEVQRKEIRKVLRLVKPLG